MLVPKMAVSNCLNIWNNLSFYVFVIPPIRKTYGLDEGLDGAAPGPPWVKGSLSVFCLYIEANTASGGSMQQLPLIYLLYIRGPRRSFGQKKGLIKYQPLETNLRICFRCRPNPASFCYDQIVWIRRVPYRRGRKFGSILLRAGTSSPHPQK